MAGKLETQAWVAGTIFLLGCVLLGYMVVVEGEPGAIPLLLVAVGAIWSFVIRRRARSLR
jgi:ABC-type multidrug transport system permease subunit